MKEKYQRLTSDQDMSFADEDILAAMRAIPGYIDLTPGDFKLIFEHAFNLARKKILHDTKVMDFMTTPVISINQDQPVSDLVDILTEHNISGVPVIDNTGLVVGAISEKNIFRSLAQSAEVRPMRMLAACLATPFFLTDRERAQQVKSLMTAPAITIKEDASLADVVEIFHAQDISRLPVVDQTGHLVGIIARQDSVRIFRRFL